MLRAIYISLQYRLIAIIISFDLNGRFLYFITNKISFETRHIWTTSVDFLSTVIHENLQTVITRHVISRDIRHM